MTKLVGERENNKKAHIQRRRQAREDPFIGSFTSLQELTIWVERPMLKCQKTDPETTAIGRLYCRSLYNSGASEKIIRSR